MSRGFRDSVAEMNDSSICVSLINLDTDEFILKPPREKPGVHKKAESDESCRAFDHFTRLDEIIDTEWVFLYTISLHAQQSLYGMRRVSTLGSVRTSWVLASAGTYRHQSRSAWPKCGPILACRTPFEVKKLRDKGGEKKHSTNFSKE